MRLSRTATTITFSCILAACGGGSDDDDSNNTVAYSSVVSSCGQSGGPLRVMAMGDSITEGGAGHNSYRRSFYFQMVAAGCRIDMVGSKSGVSRGARRDSGSVSAPNPDFDQNHEAYWDYQTQEVTAFAAGKVAAAQPHVVMIHLGSNDVIKGQSGSAAAAELGTLIDAIRSAKSDAHIVLAKIIPNSKVSVTAINNAIDGVAASRQQSQSPIIVVDQSSGYSVADNYDGVHPAPSGEAKIGTKFANAVLSWSR